MSKVSFSNTMVENFSVFKRVCSYVVNSQDLAALSLIIKGETDEEIGRLEPICNFLATPELASKLSSWRLRTIETFPNRFEVTDESTQRWLKEQVIANSNRILFLIKDRFGVPAGHIGLHFYADLELVELDAVMRDFDLELPPGFMSQALNELESFAASYFGLEHLSLRVLGTNERARAFYQKNGYEKTGEMGLAWKDSESRRELVECHTDSGQWDDSFVTMEKYIGQSLPPNRQILTAGPSVGPIEAFNLNRAGRYGWNDRHSEYLQTFSKVFNELVGVDFSMPTSSCTGALHLALAALEIGHGDEVIVPELTWVATASAVRYVGATPVFCDVDPRTWTMDPASVEKLITEKTKAIIPVHLYGFSAEIELLVDVARRNGLRVVEDAAPSFGTHFRNKHVGTFGDIGCFSFQGAKLLVTGEGGMVCTNDPELRDRLIKLQEHGRRPGTFWIEELGFKYKMSNILAAFGQAQLERAKSHIFRKRRISDWYREELGQLDELQFQQEHPDSFSIHWMTSIQIGSLKGRTVDEVRGAMLELGVDTRPVFPTISQYPIWESKQMRQPNATAIAESSINLPSGVLMSHRDVARVARVVKSVLA